MSIDPKPLRAGIVTAAGDYRWSSFAAHGLGPVNGLLPRDFAFPPA